METYIYLTTKDKKSLVKLAEAKQLSLSTTAGIIINNLYTIVESFYTDYINKGEKRLHIKVKRNKPLTLNGMIATNCIYCYFNRPTYKGKKINWQHKYIQSELDRTEDPNRFKNQEIRIAYRLKKGNI